MSRVADRNARKAELLQVVEAQRQELTNDTAAISERVARIDGWLALARRMGALALSTTRLESGLTVLFFAAFAFSVIAACQDIATDGLAVRTFDARERGLANGIQTGAYRVGMRTELSSAKPGQFDLKQDRGGIADIEFLAQYWALKWAVRYAEVITYSDIIRQLESLASADLVPQATADVLTDAYRAYRQRIHHLSLEKAASVVPAAEFAGTRDAVTAIWTQTMERGDEATSV